jgi:hypothetical protein
MMIVVMVGVLLLFRRSNGTTVFVIGMTSVRNWFHVAVLVGGKQHIIVSFYFFLSVAATCRHALMHENGDGQHR